MNIPPSNIAPDKQYSEDIVQVLLVGPGFSGGGAERRFSNIAANLFGGNIDVAVLSHGHSADTRTTGRIFNLGWSSRFSYLNSIWILRQRLNCSRYEVIMAFGLFPCLVSILAALFSKKGAKLVISEITRPKMEALNSRGWRTLAYNTFRKILYGYSYLITANSIDGLRETCELAGIPVENGVRVVNVVDSELVIKKSTDRPCMPLCEEKYIICVGRLDYMKRIDTVISAFGIATDHIKCNLLIVGDGEARQALESQVEALGLKESVMFTGMIDNPFFLLKNATAFVLASEYEGYSNSVLEAMFCDVPVITSFCSSDAREMCDEGAALGFGVGDISQLVEHLTAVVTDKSLSQTLVNCAITYRSPHAMENAIPFYEDLIRRVAGRTVVDSGDSHL